MKELNKILVCIDLSEHSMATMEYGVALSRGLLADIIVINVINSRDVAAVKTVMDEFPDRVNVDEYIESTQVERFKKVREMIENHFPADRDRITIHVEIGVPFRTILKEAEQEKVDVIVIGSKGRGNAMGTLFGSNAEKVFRHSKVPVFSIRDGDQHNR